MTPDLNRPSGADDHGRDDTGLPASEPTPEASDVRRMLHDRSRSITPRGTFVDVEQRIHATDANRRRNRALYSTAAAAVLVVVVAGGLALAKRSSDDTEQLDTADSIEVTSTRVDQTPTTGTEGTTTTADREPDPTEPSETIGTTQPPGVQPISERTPVRIDGIGPISVPMTVAEASSATGQDVRIEPSSRIEETSPCGFAEIDGLDQLWFMVDVESLVRVDVGGSSPLRTDAGVGVGSSETEVRATYGAQVTTEAHPYARDEDSRYLVVTDPARPGYEIIFSVHQGEVTDYRAGLAEFVRYPEGCA